MKKIIINIVSMLVIIMLLFMIWSNHKAQAFSLTEIEKQAENFIDQGESQDPTDDSEIQDIVIPIAQILVFVANIIIAIATVVMAIKYLTANPEGKAKLKTQLVGLVVSTIVIFGAQFIWSLLYDFLKDV